MSPPSLADAFLADYLEFYPTLGTRLGLHLYDGRPDDLSAGAIDAWLRSLAGWERRLAAALEAAGAQDRFDLALAAQAAAAERVRWETLRDHERSPLVASDLLDVTPYIKRAYAPLPERLFALAAYLEDLPASLAAASRHLREPLPRPVVETATDVLQGYLTYYTDILPRATQHPDPAVRARLDRGREATVQAIRAFLAFLDDAARRAVEAFAIGEPAFAAMLRAGEMVETPVARLISLGEAELARLLDDLAATAARIDPRETPRAVMASLGRHHPAAGALVAETAALLDDLRGFIAERGLLTLAEETWPIVEETPPFARWAFAMMDTAGPFETAAAESFYYVTPPEPDWPPAQQEQWLTKFDYATLKAVSIHEAYPGHFVHFTAIRRAASRPAKVFTTYSFTEGWAHYAEEMMLEAGVDLNPQFRLAVLAEALVRQVRYLAAIHMHCGDMTVGQAEALFRDAAFMEEAPAAKEAVRGTFDPGYLNYTLGKFMVRRLRDDYRARRGPAFSLREFHDRLLATGAPPIPLARRRLLGDGADAGASI